MTSILFPNFSSYRYLIQIPNLVEKLSLLNDKYECDQFILLLMDRLINGLGKIVTLNEKMKIDLESDGETSDMEVEGDELLTNHDVCLRILHEVKLNSGISEKIAL